MSRPDKSPDTARRLVHECAGVLHAFDETSELPDVGEYEHLLKQWAKIVVCTPNDLEHAADFPMYCIVYAHLHCIVHLARFGDEDVVYFDELQRLRDEGITENRRLVMYSICRCIYRPETVRHEGLVIQEELTAAQRDFLYAFLQQVLCERFLKSGTRNRLFRSGDETEQLKYKLDRTIVVKLVETEGLYVQALTLYQEIVSRILLCNTHAYEKPDMSGMFFIEHIKDIDKAKLYSKAVRTMNHVSDFEPVPRTIAACVAFFVSLTYSLFSVEIPVFFNAAFVAPGQYAESRNVPSILLHRDGFMAVYSVPLEKPTASKELPRTVLFADPLHMIIFYIRRWIETTHCTSILKTQLKQYIQVWKGDWKPEKFASVFSSFGENLTWILGTRKQEQTGLLCTQTKQTLNPSLNSTQTLQTLQTREKTTRSKNSNDLPLMQEADS